MTLARSFRTVPAKEAKPMKGPRTVKCGLRGCLHRFVLNPASPVRWCSIECGTAIALERLAGKKAKLAKADRAATKVQKDSLKRRADYIEETQKAFNAYCRERDREQQCISCGVHLPAIADTPGGGVDCGHYRSRGSAPHLRFHEDNAHGQCKRCNRYKAGNVTEYRPRLIARIGLAAVEALECDQSQRKWTILELQAMKDEYRARLKKLTKGTT